MINKDGFLRFIKFGIVGSSGIVVNQATLMALGRLTAIPLEIRSPIAIEMAIISNFFLNYFWTWGDAEKSDTIKKLLKFNISSGLTSLLFNYIPLIIMVNFLNLNETISNLIGIAIASGFNFLISHFWTFRDK